MRIRRKVKGEDIHQTFIWLSSFFFLTTYVLSKSGLTFSGRVMKSNDAVWILAITRNIEPVNY